MFVEGFGRPLYGLICFCIFVELVLWFFIDVLFTYYFFEEILSMVRLWRTNLLCGIVCWDVVGLVGGFE